MDKSTNKSVAESLETRETMLPLMPELLQDLWAMGCSPELLVQLLKPLNLDPSKTKVLDLACGKGAAAVTLAAELGFSAAGIDASIPFLNEAKKMARQKKVAGLCRFETADIREYVKKQKYFDVVIYASLGSLLGDFRQIVSALRKMVRSGGYMIIDDGFLKGEKQLERPGYEHYRTHRETIKQLIHAGDILIKERLTVEENRVINTYYIDVIKKRAKVMIERKPAQKALIDDYIANQEAECEILEREIVGAIWLLKKGPEV